MLNNDSLCNCPSGLGGGHVDDCPEVMQRRARETLDDMISLPSPCICGGRYSLGFDELGSAMITHSIPFCQRFMDCDTDQDAVRFSEENRQKFEN